MKRYYNEAETPLKFHKLYHYLIIPYTCLTGVLALFGYAVYPEPFTLGLRLELGFTAAFVILTAVIFMGFFSFSSYAWYCLMGYLGLTMLQGLSAVCLIFLLMPEELYIEAVKWTPDIFLPPLIALYYIKRKPLFFPQKDQAPSKPVSVTEAAAVPLQEIPPNKGLFCVNCGKKLKEDYVFCPDCGSPQ